MTECSDQTEGKSISSEDEERVRNLLDPNTKGGRVCIRMLDHGDTIGNACLAEGIDPPAAMAYWHRVTDENGILSVEGKRPCISVLANAWKRRWQQADAAMWAPVGDTFATTPAVGPMAQPHGI